MPLPLPVTTLLTRLRQETSHQHALLESQLPLLDRTLTRDAYRQLLGRFWGYYAPLEQFVLSVIRRNAVAFDYEARLKTPLLENDLRALRLPAALLPRCANLPALAGVPQLLGCLYVLEGSTLGGRVITQRLVANQALQADSGGAFFAGYGTATAVRWREFGKFLTETAIAIDQDNLIVAGAKDTFETFATWLSGARVAPGRQRRRP
jgi:heme oxygenase